MKTGRVVSGGVARHAPVFYYSFNFLCRQAARRCLVSCPLSVFLPWRGGGCTAVVLCGTVIRYYVGAVQWVQYIYGPVANGRLSRCLLFAHVGRDVGGVMAAREWRPSAHRSRIGRCCPAPQARCLPPLFCVLGIYPHCHYRTAHVLAVLVRNGSVVVVVVSVTCQPGYTLASGAKGGTTLSREMAVGRSIDRTGIIVVCVRWSLLAGPSIRRSWPFAAWRRARPTEVRKHG